MVVMNRTPLSLEIPSLGHSTAVVLVVGREAPGGGKLIYSTGGLEFIAQDSQDVAELSVAVSSLVLGRSRRNLA